MHDQEVVGLALRLLTSDSSDFGLPMPQFIPLDALHNRSAEAAAFELWLPNRIMGRALFLRLPLDRGWTFEFNPEEAEASRYMVYRDRMWVREGKARIFAIRTDGSRVEVNVRVNRWRPRSSNCDLTREPRRQWLFRRWLGTEGEEVIRSRCCRTERQMQIWWKAEDARPRAKTATDAGEDQRLAQSDLELLLSSLHCH